MCSPYLADRGLWRSLAATAIGHFDVKVYCGMPRLEDRILDCAFYLYRDLQSAKDGSEVGGTGFVIARTFDSPALGGAGVLYLVSNKHVVHAHACSVARLNKKDGGVDFFELEPQDWIAHPYHDVAAVMSRKIDPNVHQCTWARASDMLDRSTMVESDIGIGDDVFMIGRFIGHDGKTRNRPSARFGNISIGVSDMMNPATGLPEESFGVEMRSKPGFSGSPVFVYDFLSRRAFEEGKPRRQYGFLRLLGIEWGIISESMPVLNKWGVQQDNQYIVAPSGMNGVVPAWWLKDLLDMPELKHEFDSIEKANLNQVGLTRGVIQPALATEDAGDRATAANPTHREDFNRLLGEAAQRREQED